MAYYGVKKWVVSLEPGYRPSVLWFEIFHDPFLFCGESPALEVEAELRLVGGAEIW